MVEYVMHVGQWKSQVESRWNEEQSKTVKNLFWKVGEGTCLMLSIWNGVTRAVYSFFILPLNWWCEINILNQNHTSFKKLDE